MKFENNIYQNKKNNLFWSSDEQEDVQKRFQEKDRIKIYYSGSK